MMINCVPLRLFSTGVEYRYCVMSWINLHHINYSYCSWFFCYGSIMSWSCYVAYITHIRDSKFCSTMGVTSQDSPSDNGDVFNSLWPSDVICVEYLGHDWLRQWLVAWWHQTIACSDVDLPWTVSGIHSSGTFTWMPKISIHGLCLKFSHWKSPSHHSGTMI